MERNFYIQTREMETLEELTFHLSCRKPDPGILLSSPVICYSVEPTSLNPVQTII